MIKYENLAKVNEPFLELINDAVQNVVSSGWYILGNSVSNFENEFASYLNAAHAVGVANGLDALILSLRALQLPKGSEVLVPSNTYIATILAVVNEGFVPVLVEPDVETYNIDHSLLRSKIGPSTKAIIIVHLYGKPCEMDPIIEICEEYGLRIIEDCAQSHGASYKGKRTGTFGNFGCFSFYPTKNLGCMGDGGMIVCDNEHDAQRLRTLRNYGSNVKYKNELIGMNSRLDELQATILSVKLPYVDQMNQHRQRIAEIYTKNLSEKIRKPKTNSHSEHVFHIYNILIKKRDDLKRYLEQKDVQTEIHYPIPPHKQIAMKEIITENFPISTMIHECTLSLPISTSTSEADAKRVCNLINTFVEANDI